MNLKQRFSFIFSCLFSAVLATVMLMVYYLVANLRQNEFIGELTEKAQTTVKILIQVKEADYAMQKIIDSNSVNKLYNEKTQVYDENRKLIYSSTNNPAINWTTAEFDAVKKHKSVLKKNVSYVVLGIYSIVENHGYYTLISADDTYYNNKLHYVQYILFGAFVTGAVTVWLLSFGLSKKALQPLDSFRRQIHEIGDSNLKVRLHKARREDEINALASSFNQMMDRINNAYDRQREFTSIASHELRTPLARIAAQVENLLHKSDLDTATLSNLNSISEDTFQLSEMISSLVALADINSRENELSFERLRLDEIIFSTAAALSATFPDFKLKFEIENTSTYETDLEISGDETLLKIALLNLFKNAYNYSDDHLIECLIRQTNLQLELFITNTGAVPAVVDTAVLFTTFFRGSNAGAVPGSGVGLSIVKRVFDYHNSTVVYNIINQNTNQLMVTFPHRPFR